MVPTHATIPQTQPPKMCVVFEAQMLRDHTFEIKGAECTVKIDLQSLDLKLMFILIGDLFSDLKGLQEEGFGRSV